MSNEKFSFELMKEDGSARLGKISTQRRIRSAQNMLRHKINDLQIENLRLRNSSKELQAYTKKVSNTQKQLETILSSEGMALDGFIQLVEDNKIVLQKMKVNPFLFKYVEAIRTSVILNIFRYRCFT